MNILTRLCHCLKWPSSVHGPTCSDPELGDEAGPRSGWDVAVQVSEVEGQAHVCVNKARPKGLSFIAAP